jgi:parallel beta-helix repeat protein
MVNSNPVSSGTVYPESHITVDTVWNMTKSPIYIEGNVTVNYGVNLTIEPGVEVFFNGFYNLYIEGNLSAVGNETNMIKFTSNESMANVSYSDWESIQVNATGNITISYCNITYAQYGISISQSEKENQIQNNLITDNWIGIRIFESTNCTLANNNVSDNYNHGIFLSYSYANRIQDNYLTNNGRLSLGNGLHLHYSDDNIILNNIIWNNRFRGIYLFWSNTNDIRFNWIHSNLYDGVYITQSYDNQLRNNNISLNGYSVNHPGINLTISSQNNRIYHNTIIDNAIQAIDGTNNSNLWDDGYPNGGNFWSDYIGVDFNRSEQQDFPTPDGLGDTPYFIDLDSYDRYPLMNKMRNIAPFLIALISPLNESVIKQGVFIDLDILVQDFNKVNFTVNGGSNTTLNDPFDINTTTWFDGDNRLDVYVIDESSNYNLSWFSFVFDSTKPIIQLISPQNNSVFRAGEIINLSIIDPNIKFAYYNLSNLSGNLSQPLLFPYEINTSLWTDGNYNLEIHAEDVANNTNSTQYAFVVDSSPPEITLDSPRNNSYIKPVTPITFSILDDHLDPGTVTYQIDGQSPQTFTTPYTINTAGWEDETYVISVSGGDILGNSITNSFNITIDSIAPSVFLLHPLNNSVIKKGTFLNFSVSDESPILFTYSFNLSLPAFLLPPYEIDTSTLDDGVYSIYLNVSDYADNTNMSWYQITIDSTEPEIELATLSNNSSIRAGDDIVFDIVEPNLLYANYSVNDGDFGPLLPSLSIDTTGWPEGVYTIEVEAVDEVGNDNSAIFIIYVDNSRPRIVATNPQNDEGNVKLSSVIIIKFSEVMDKDSVEQAISISPDINYTTAWSIDNLTLVITPDANLKNSTEYTITIDKSATDVAGNTMRNSFKLKFNTGSTEKFDWLMIIFPLLLAIILISIIVLYLIYRKSDETSKEEEAPDENEFDVEGKRKGHAGELEDKIIEEGLEEEELEKAELAKEPLEEEPQD